MSGTRLRGQQQSGKYISYSEDAGEKLRGQGSAGHVICTSVWASSAVTVAAAAQMSLLGRVGRDSKEVTFEDVGLQRDS